MSSFKFVFTAFFMTFMVAGSPILPAQNAGSANPGHTDIRVQKETDENGNVIRYDSVYTWSWSNMGIPGMEEMLPDLDSLFQALGLNGSLLQGFGNLQIPGFPELKELQSGDWGQVMQQQLRMMEEMMNGMQFYNLDSLFGIPFSPAPNPEDAEKERVIKL